MRTKWLRGSAILWVVGVGLAAAGAAAQSTNNLQSAITTMTQALEARDVQALMQRVAPDFVLESMGGDRLDRKQFEQVWERTLPRLSDLKVTLPPLFPSGRGREVTFTTDFHITGHTEPMPRPLRVTRLESGVIMTTLADPQRQRYIVYVGTVEQTWTQTRQGWKLKRQRILREKKTVDPRPFTLPMLPGGAGDREVEILTPTPPASEAEELFDFRPPSAAALLLQQPVRARPRNRR